MKLEYEGRAVFVCERQKDTLTIVFIDKPMGNFGDPSMTDLPEIRIISKDDPDLVTFYELSDELSECLHSIEEHHVWPATIFEEIGQFLSEPLDTNVLHFLQSICDDDDSPFFEALNRQKVPVATRIPEVGEYFDFDGKTAKVDRFITKTNSWRIKMQTSKKVYKFSNLEWQEMWKLKLQTLHFRPLFGSNGKETLRSWMTKEKLLKFKKMILQDWNTLNSHNPIWKKKVDILASLFCNIFPDDYPIEISTDTWPKGLDDGPFCLTLALNQWEVCIGTCYDYQY